MIKHGLEIIKMEVYRMKGNKQLEQNKQEDSMSFLSRSLLTGFIGGLLWSGLGVAAYYFNFSMVAPRTYVLRSWLTAEWTDTWLGNIISILIVGAISVLVAFLYYGLFKKVNSMWMGVAFGIILWAILFFVLHPIFPNVAPITNIDQNTVVTTLSLFILYGTFVGYSISYDYNDMVLKEEQKGNS